MPSQITDVNKNKDLILSMVAGTTEYHLDDAMIFAVRITRRARLPRYHCATNVRIDRASDVISSSTPPHVHRHLQHEVYNTPEHDRDVQRLPTTPLAKYPPWRRECMDTEYPRLHKRRLQRQPSLGHFCLWHFQRNHDDGRGVHAPIFLFSAIRPTAPTATTTRRRRSRRRGDQRAIWQPSFCHPSLNVKYFLAAAKKSLLSLLEPRLAAKPTPSFSLARKQWSCFPVYVFSRGYPASSHNIPV